MLLAWWFLALLIAGAAGFPILAAVLGVRRHHRKKAGRPVIHGWRLAGRRLSLVFASLVFGLAATAAGVNDHYSYIPSWHALFGDVSPDLVSHPVAASTAVARAHGSEGAAAGQDAMPVVKRSDHGTVEKVEVGGPASGVSPRDTYVYLPPDYFDPAHADERFPVLYLLHGSPGISVDWLRAGWVDRALDDLLAKHRIAPYIVVLPDVNGGYRRDTECEDIAGGPLTQTYLVRDVVGYVDANYRTIADRRARAIGGLSTGGYCAVNLTLRHQDVFSAMISHSGYDRPDQNLYTGDLFGGNREEERANTPGQYLPTIPITQPLAAYFDVGMGDNGSRTESAAMVKVLQQRGVTVAYHDFADESHNWAAWRRNLFSSLPWLSSWFASTGVSTAPDTGGTAVVAAPAPPAPGGAPSGSVAAAPPGTPRGAESAPAADDAAAPPDALHIIPQEPSAPAVTVERHLPPSFAGHQAGHTGPSASRHRPRRSTAVAGPPTPAQARLTPAPVRRGAS
ncbi:MAG TPA: alpha/beta hydrolase-fold protein [Acidimicrobiia bacterium]|nr:alpha/beta hydrolase-fold protein [Acidimicrobiia bacterium]HZQ75907.1 alpha/beta hydrolase-fold protein [Acidimicrobiia bacterium]